jgi:DNA-binding NarL/FixJ family response regulator
MFTEREWGMIGRELGLSVRELQVAQGVFDDMKELAIAHQLGIAKTTVHSHVGRLYKKLQVKNQAQLVLRIVWTSGRMTSIEPRP